MSENYKPGTVAVATVRGVTGVRVYRGLTGWAAPADPGRGLNVGVLHESDVTDVRPLVVLDLDDAYGCWAERRDPALIVERLRNTSTAAAHAIADQIEAQTSPPKPAEPTGLGAVVKDAGKSWVHFGNGCWIQETPNANLRVRSWANFSDDVEVDR